MSIACLALVACGPSDKQRSDLAEKKRIECLDKFCNGDVEPKRNIATEVAFKLNDQWYVGPKTYGNPNFGAISFFWPSKAAGGDAVAVANAKEVRKNAAGNVDNFYDVAIEIFLRSNNIPPEPRGFKAVERWESEGRIVNRKTVRRGLDALQIRRADGAPPQSTTYVATDVRGFDGLPPLVSCDHTHPDHGCSSGFMWRDGIFVGIRMNQRHGLDWPEIFQEIARVLQLLQKA